MREEARFADFPRVCLPILGFRKMYSFCYFYSISVFKFQMIPTMCKYLHIFTHFHFLTHFHLKVKMSEKMKMKMSVNECK